MLFFRQLTHLLPDSVAWRVTIRRTLRRFLEGLSLAPADVRGFIDSVFDDLFPSTTRALTMWEAQFGLTSEPAETDTAARAQLAATWAAQGGQSPHYLQSVVRAAGFDVYVHEWWTGADVAPRTPRDPRLYTLQPLIGSVQCGESLARCGNPGQECNRFLVNEPGYLVNRDLSQRAPPPVPDDPARWPYFLYFGTADLLPETRANVSPERREEFERLLLKLCPVEQWIVTHVDYA